MRRIGLIALLTLALSADPVAAQIERGSDRGGRVVFTNAPTGAYGASASAPRRPVRRTSIPVPQAAPRELPGLIREVAMRHGVSPNLVRAVVAVESAYDPRAVSPKGARGLMQLMPATASELGVKDVYDPRENLEGGTRYLRGLLDTYDGDVRLALAGYNAGATAVQRYGGVPPYPETRQYVRRVLELRSRLDAAVEIPHEPGVFRFRNSAGTVVMSNIPADALRRPLRVAKMP